MDSCLFLWLLSLSEHKLTQKIQKNNLHSFSLIIQYTLPTLLMYFINIACLIQYWYFHLWFWFNFLLSRGTLHLIWPTLWTCIDSGIFHFCTSTIAGTLVKDKCDNMFWYSIHLTIIDHWKINTSGCSFCDVSRVCFCLLFLCVMPQ